MATVELRSIYKTYENTEKPAVTDANFVVKDREFVVLVGPSGCGKSTTLRMIAGLESISKGELLIDNQVVNDIAPKDRNIAMVFQNYALYPHMSVYENMAFGLKIRKLPKDEIDKRVREAARILDIEQYLERKPKALSGGQRQRVAIGRAIVRQPKVFLFDEPLSNLDAKLRVQMRAEIIALNKRLEATMVYVNHDQVEAMTMGDMIVVMKDGFIQQIGSPIELYDHPVNKFVAGFIGSPPMNFIDATIKAEGKKVTAMCDGLELELSGDIAAKVKPFAGKCLTLGIRPEDLHDDKEKEKGSHVVMADVNIIEPLGAETYVHFTAGSSKFMGKFRSMTTAKPFEKKRPVRFDLSKLHFFDCSSDGELAL